MPATATTYTSTGPADLLIVKMDPACNVLWARDIGQLGSAIVAWSIASDDASHVFVAGDFNGTVDFGTGPIDSNSQDNLQDMAVDAKGDVAVLGYGGSFAGMNVLDSSGALLYEEDESASFSSDVAGSCIGGNAAGEWVVAGGSGSDSDQALAVTLGPSGSSLWNVLLSVPYPQPTLDEVRAVLDTSGNAFVFGAWQAADDAGTIDALTPYLLAGVSTGGAVRWSLSPSDWVQPPEATLFDPWHHQLAVDGAGNVFVGLQLGQSAAFGALGTMALTGTSDSAFLVADSSGHVRAAGHWGVAGLTEGLISMAVDTADGVVLTRSTPNVLNPPSGTLVNFFVTKMGW